MKIYIQTAEHIKEKMLERLPNFFDKSEVSNLLPVPAKKYAAKCLRIQNFDNYFWILMLRNGVIIKLYKGEICIESKEFDYVVLKTGSFKWSENEYFIHLMKADVEGLDISELKNCRGYVLTTSKVLDNEKEFFVEVEVDEEIAKKLIPKG